MHQLFQSTLLTLTLLNKQRKIPYGVFILSAPSFLKQVSVTPSPHFYCFPSTFSSFLLLQEVEEEKEEEEEEDEEEEEEEEDEEEEAEGKQQR